MRILTAQEMKAAEDEANRRGTSYEQLMENAGTAAVSMLESLQPPGKKILFLCGKGNNGGDALVMARLLAGKNWQQEVVLLCGNTFSPLANLNFDRLPSSVRVFTEPPQKWAGDVLVDGVFGTGFRGELPDHIQAAFKWANRQEAIRFALDLPSGLNCDTGEGAQHTFAANYTCTFGAFKPGLLAGDGPALCGKIQLADIGL